MARTRECEGFTMVELIVVIAVTAVIAAVAIPRFMGRGAFDVRGFADRTQGFVRYAQKSAIAKRLPVFVVITAGSVSVCYDAACASPVMEPVSGAAMIAAVPSAAVALSTAPTPVPTTFSFNGLGQPSFAALLTVTVTGEIARSFVVEPETGYVHP